MLTGSIFQHVPTKEWVLHASLLCVSCIVGMLLFQVTFFVGSGSNAQTSKINREMVTGKHSEQEMKKDRRPSQGPVNNEHFIP
jgi:hypothetical protein